MQSFDQIFASLLSIIPAIALHEFGHAAMANKLGDPTPRLQGRLTLNPVAHFDPLGALMIVMTTVTGFGLGWGKPVQVNPTYFPNYRQGLILVAIAGPLMNLCLACLTIALSYIMFMAGLPLSGFAQTFVLSFLIINIVLIAFNMLPIPPLDGGNVLINLLPQKYGWQLQKWAPFGLLVILGLMFAGILSAIIGFIFGLVMQFIAAVFGQEYIMYLVGRF